MYWQASQNGYQLVLAPEGVPQVSVNWYALLAPVLGWIGFGLLAYRLADLLLARGRRPLIGALRPLAGELAPTVSATMSRQRQLLARAVALVALTAAFAGSTSVFNATYQAQAEVDARLSNGADVTVTESPAAHVGPQQGLAQLGHIPGVASVEPLQHRFAYIGADLQDLYGVRPQTITSQGKLQNGWFAGGTAAGLMKLLATQPDAHPRQRRDRPRLPAPARGHDPAAAAKRAEQAADHDPVPLRGRRQGVPHCPEGLVLRRQPELHNGPNRLCRRRQLPRTNRRDQSRGRPPAHRARPRIKRAGHRHR